MFGRNESWAPWCGACEQVFNEISLLSTKRFAENPLTKTSIPAGERCVFSCRCALSLISRIKARTLCGDQQLLVIGVCGGFCSDIEKKGSRIAVDMLIAAPLGVAVQRHAAKQRAKVASHSSMMLTFLKVQYIDQVCLPDLYPVGFPCGVFGCSSKRGYSEQVFTQTHISNNRPKRITTVRPTRTMATPTAPNSLPCLASVNTC